MEAYSKTLKPFNLQESPRVQVGHEYVKTEDLSQFWACWFEVKEVSKI